VPIKGNGFSVSRSRLKIKCQKHWTVNPGRPYSYQRKKPQSAGISCQRAGKDVGRSKRRTAPGTQQAVKKAGEGLSRWF